MCILFCYTNPHPSSENENKSKYRLIIASNRDESYTRPARPAFQCHETGVIGGRDMEKGREGGMWLGIVLKPNLFKFGALLNVTGAAKRKATKGRGPLVANYLETDQKAGEYVAEVEKDGLFSSFNLIMAEMTRSDQGIKTFHYSNSPEKLYEWTEEQCLGFGNSTPESPLNKVENGRRKFEEIVKSSSLSREKLVEELLGLLKCEERWLPDEELKRRSGEGVYRFLSQIYVEAKEAGYGTRTHSIVLVDDEYNVEFIEHTMREPINFEAPEWDVTVIKGQL